MTDPVRAAMRRQSSFCHAMGAPVVARVCDALAEMLDDATATGRRVLAWPGDPTADALPLRLVGGLHALALTGDGDARRLFAADTGRADGGRLAAALLARHDAALLPWLDGPPQTNEVGRAAPLMLGLMAVARRFPQPMQLLEIGASAGLNLLLPRFGFDLGGVAIGPADAPIRLRPEWRGSPPRPAAVTITDARGVDVAPLDATDPAQALRLRAYVWAGDPERMARMDAALALAAAHPPRLDAGDAAGWVAERLAEPHPAGTTRVLLHSVVWQYLGPERQARIRDLLDRAGAAATPARPLAWVRMEPDRDMARHAVRVRLWPDGTDRQLATSHPHGTWIDTQPQEIV